VPVPGVESRALAVKFHTIFMKKKAAFPITVSLHEWNSPGKQEVANGTKGERAMKAFIADDGLLRARIQKKKTQVFD